MPAGQVDKQDIVDKREEKERRIQEGNGEETESAVTGENVA